MATCQLRDRQDWVSVGSEGRGGTQDDSQVWAPSPSPTDHLHHGLCVHHSLVSLRTGILISSLLCLSVYAFAHDLLSPQCKPQAWHTVGALMLQNIITLVLRPPSLKMSIEVLPVTSSIRYLMKGQKPK